MQKILQYRLLIEEIGNSSNKWLTRIRTPKYPHARQAVLEYIDLAHEKGDTVSVREVKLVAVRAEREFNPGSTFKASNGWWDRFRKAFDLELKPLSGEQYFADNEAARQYVEDLSPFLTYLNIPLHNIFNADESSIIFRPQIKSTVTRSSNKAPPSRGVEKESMTFMPIVNATGINIYLR